jgi:hypothetical protein
MTISWSSNVLRAASLLALTVSLASCDNIDAANSTIGRVGDMTGAQAAKMAQLQRGGVFQEHVPYYGSEVQVAEAAVHGTPLPRQFSGVHGFAVSLKDAGIQMIASTITQKSGIPVNVRTRYVLPDGKLVEVPIGSRMTVTHQGSLGRFLDLVADRMDVGWSYDGTSITFDRMLSNTYALPIPNTASQFATSIAGVTGTQSGAARSATLTTKSSEEPWAELKAALAPITPSPAYATYQEDMGRVTVFGPPSVQRQASKVIDDFNAVFSTRIGLEIGVFWVKANKTADFAAALSASGTHFALTSPLTLAGGGVATINSGIGSLNLQALAANQDVVDYRIGSTIAQSGVVSPIVLTTTQNYVSGTSVTSGVGGTTSTSITTASVDTGLSIHALPRLISHHKIQLDLTILNNDLTALQSFNAGSSTVQLPTVDQRAIHNDSVLRPGETLILSGYEQDTASRTKTRAFPGVGNNTSATKMRMIVIVRPTIIPLNGG